MRHDHAGNEHQTVSHAFDEAVELGFLQIGRMLQLAVAALVVRAIGQAILVLRWQIHVHKNIIA
jgi:hypothetical protein